MIKRFLTVGIGIIWIYFSGYAETVYLFTEEGEIIEGTLVNPEEMGLLPKNFELLFVEEGGEIIIEKLAVEEEYIEEEVKLVLFPTEENKYIVGYESPWDGEEEEISGEEEVMPEEEYEY